MRVGEISREGQVLDWRPSGDQTKLPDVVVRVAGGDARSGCDPEADTSGSANQRLGRVVVTDPGIGAVDGGVPARVPVETPPSTAPDRKSTRLNSSHMSISYAVFCLKKKNK